MKNSNLIRFDNFVSLVVILSLLLGMAACSAAKTPSPTETTQGLSPVPIETTQSLSADPTQALTPSILPKAEQGDVTISFSSDKYSRSVFELLMEEFHQENPSITVKFVETAENTGQSISDLFRVETAKADSTNSYSNASIIKDFFIDLQPYMDADPSFHQEDFYPGTLSACKDPQGLVRGIPFTLNIGGIFYDRSAFDAANIPYPQPGWTWDDFRKDVALLTQAQNGVTRFGYANVFYNSILEPFIGINLEKNGGSIDEKTLSTEIQWYADMAQKGQLLEIEGDFNNEQEELAYKRWHAMFADKNGPALWYGRLISYTPDLFGTGTDEDNPLFHPAITRFGYAPFPISGDGSMDHTTPVTAQCFAISASSPHPAEAWMWLSFLSQHLRKEWFDHQRDGSGLLEFLPARKSVAEESGFWEGYSVQDQTAIRYGVEHAWYAGMYYDTLNAVLVAIQKAANGGTDLTQAIAEAKAQLKAAQ
jgi:multiple sugar transport system substrate-binding protein